MADLFHFPLNYSDARRRFLQLREEAAGAKSLETWTVSGAKDDDLAVDTIYLPPTGKPQRLFVIISGVHGLEAYAGHGIQSMFMRDLLPKADRANTGFFLIHSLNPYGFKHHRRGTEANVNLNRNCSTYPELYKTKNTASLELAGRFVPKKPVDGETCFLLRHLREENSKIWFEDVSLDEFIKSVGLGQFESPEGLEFGGFGPEPQIARMIRALKEIVPGYQDIVLFDLHTGLGERARLHLLTGDVDGCVHPDLFAELFEVGNDRKVYDFTPADEEGFYKTYGATNNIFPELAAGDQRVCAMTMEFGTLGHSRPAQLESLNQWLLEHQGSLYGYASAGLERKVRADYLEKFFPADPEWRAQILATSREFLERVFSRSKVLR